MATSQMSVSDQIRQLDGARKLVLSDVSYYHQVVQATIPIIGPGAALEFRRWGADFLAEAFSSPALPMSKKESLLPLVLETLRALLEQESQEALVPRSCILTASSIWSLGIRWLVGNGYDTTTWERMTAIKTSILRIWDTALPTVRICCTKFVQRVILVQTASVNQEPRRGDPLDISLNIIPSNHSLLSIPTLEAEATGLLDRMLQVFQDNSDALVVDATLNTLSILVRTRPATSNRILNSILSFNPFKLANTSPMTPKIKMQIRSMEKTTRMFLIHLSKRDPQNPHMGRIQAYVERLIRTRSEILDEGSKKRALMDQHMDGLDAKRQRMGTQAAQIPQLQITPLKPGPHSLAEIFTLTDNNGLRMFDVNVVPMALAARISVTTLARIDPQLLDQAIAGVKSRLTVMREAAAQPINPETAPLGVEEDDDYEPDFYAAEDTEQILNKLDSAPPEHVARGRELQKPEMGIAPIALPAFKLPPPPTLTPEQAARVGQGTVARVFGIMKTIEEPALVVKKSKAGINRLAASAVDKDAWITIITRLATRANAGLEDVEVKAEDDPVARSGVSLSNAIREGLYAYILEDFRKRIDTAVSWLNEEWYNDQIRKRSLDSESHTTVRHYYYDKWSLRLLDGFLPYLHHQDKVLTRFLSELPQLSREMLARVKGLCRDPSMVNLALTTLLYLVMMRPPVREMALDTVQDVWKEFEDARPMAGKYLGRWRPGFVEGETGGGQGGADGGPAVAAVAT